jgi:HAD superfamily hydrolase (TIGR01490 family)
MRMTQRSVRVCLAAFITGVQDVSIALFDLDNTLIAGDSDFLWGCFLVEQGIVDGTSYERANRRFYDQYKVGELDIHEFLAFQLRPLAEHDLPQLQRWRAQYVEEKIVPILLPRARQLVAHHRERGDTLVVITATNRFITSPIVGLYGIEHLLATEPELVDGRFTGGVAGIPCFQDGKVRVLEDWVAGRQLSLEDSCFYSDSHNDLPLLKRVTWPTAVDPDEILEAHARQQDWPVISLR